MPTTSNFGWTTPADTDLVKDGALAIRTLGNGVDASMAELKGGTTGQILSKTSNTDMDFTWINNDQGDITEVAAGTGITVTSGTGPIPTVALTTPVSVANGGTGITSFGTGVATFLGTPSSANLAAALTDETGTGSAVFATSPTLVTPNLGTPSAATLTNATGLPITAGTTGTLGETRGGTNQTTYTTGDLLYASAANTLTKRAIGTSGQVLTVSGGIPTWANAASGALVLTGSSDFTTSSSVVVSNCFSSTYDYYVAYIDFSAASGNAGIDIKMRSGATSASTNYNSNRIYWSGTTATASETIGGTSFGAAEVSNANVLRCAATIEFIDPGIARATKIFAKARFLNVNTSYFGHNVYGEHNTATAYDSLEIIPSTGTISGTVRIYGYAKS